MASVAGLCCRGGWTRRLIDTLLGEPDKLARNPHYASAAPMRLYLLEAAGRKLALPVLGVQWMQQPLSRSPLDSRSGLGPVR
jgi:hypothetical protein